MCSFVNHSSQRNCEINCVREIMGNEAVPTESGIYVARIYSCDPMPVTRDKRYVDVCARVDQSNVKVGKAKNLAARRKSYWKDFDRENVEFIPLLLVEDTHQAEQAILKRLNKYRKRSPKGRLMDWLENIDLELVINEVYSAVEEEGILYRSVKNEQEVKKMINIEEFHPKFIMDDKGHRQSVVIPIRDFRSLMDDIEDLAIIAERKGEPVTDHDEFVNELKNSGIL